jgi:hypothetical protein
VNLMRRQNGASDGREPCAETTRAREGHEHRSCNGTESTTPRITSLGGGRLKLVRVAELDDWLT